MERKLFRYRPFNAEKLNCYSDIHHKVINIEKWKLEAFEGIVQPSSPLYFNDPYDCEFCFQSDALASILSGETYLHLLERRFSLKPEEKDRILHAENVESIERAMQIISQARGEKLSASWMDALQDRLRDSRSKIRDAVRVVCLSEVYDSMLMWSHYAQNHTGFCIEYDFKGSDTYYKHLYPVAYTKDRYAVSKTDMSNENTEWIYKSTCSKSDVWSYEKEWRIVTANFDKVMPQKLENPNGKYVLNLKDNIKAFYLGAKISEDYEKEMIQFGKENSIGIYQMTLSPSTYELYAKKIL